MTRALVLALILASGCSYSARVHRGVNAVLATATGAALLCDGMQTNSALGSGGIFMEGNPMIGSDPSAAKINAIVWSQAVGAYGLLTLPLHGELGEWMRTIVLVAPLALEASTVYRNADLTDQSVLSCGMRQRNR